MRTRPGSKLDRYRRELYFALGCSGSLDDSAREWARVRFWRRFVRARGRVDLRVEKVLDRFDEGIVELARLNLNGNPGKVT